MVHSEAEYSFNHVYSVYKYLYTYMYVAAVSDGSVFLFRKERCYLIPQASSSLMLDGSFRGL